MLQQLSIRNFAIIQTLDIQFHNGYSVITGETGAGKSIILGALSLVLGERADSGTLMNPQEKCIIEAIFNIEQLPEAQAILQEEALDLDFNTTIRREILPSGKSRAFINDTPVNLTVLNRFSNLLVDLHRQFDNHAIDEDTFIFSMVDAVAGNLQTVQTFQSNFQNYLKKQQQVQVLQQELLQAQKEADYHQFLYNELEEAQFKTNELEDSESLVNQGKHSEQIITILQETSFSLEESEQAINITIKRLFQQLQQLENIMPAAGELGKRLESTFWELKDIASEAARLHETIEINPAQLRELEERLNIGYKLLKKHGLQTTEELLVLKDELAQKINNQNISAEQLNTLEKEVTEVYQQLQKTAQTIHLAREKALPEMLKNIHTRLQQIGMPNARLDIRLSTSSSLNKHGIDTIELLWDANNSERWSLLRKSASGGELSRIMLSIKTLVASALALPTLIFDEVDTGISGEAAKQVGLLLHELGRHHQVICITHQPQVAAKSNQHFYVYKKPDTEGKTTTSIKQLSAEQHITAIAQMIDGDKPSQAALENAKILISA